MISSGLREYVVSPLLVSNIPSGQFCRRKLELDAKREGQLYRPERLDWWSMRSQKIPDSALSGAISGGFLNAWKRVYSFFAHVFRHLLNLCPQEEELGFLQA